MTKGSKSMSVVMAGLMAVSSFGVAPVAAFAETLNDTTITDINGNGVDDSLEEIETAATKTTETTTTKAETAPTTTTTEKGTAVSTTTPVETAQSVSTENTSTDTSTTTVVETPVKTTDTTANEAPSEQVVDNSTDTPVNSNIDTPADTANNTADTTGSAADNTTDQTDTKTDDTTTSDTTNTSDTKVDDKSDTKSNISTTVTDDSNKTAEDNTTNIDNATNTPSDTTDSVEENPVQNVDSDTAVTISDIANGVKNSSYAASNVGNSTHITVHHYSQDLTTEKFIALISEQAREVGQENGIYASVMIAQAVIESGSGNSSLASDYNNLFGIKGSYNGNSVTFNTQEDDGTGSLYSTTSSFRAYDNTTESLEDYADLIKNSGYYDATWKENAATPEDAAKALQGTYATDTSYAQKIMDIINTYDLTEYDKPLDYTAKDSNINYSRTIAVVLANATSANGEDYVWGGESFQEGGFDCSGLVYYAYTNGTNGIVNVQKDGSNTIVDTNKDSSSVQANAIVDNMNDLDDLAKSMPRTAEAQAGAAAEDVPLDEEHLLPGDTLYWSNESGTYHTAIYLGRGYYLEAGSPATGVHISSLDEHTPSYAKRFIPVNQVSDEDAEKNTEVTKQELADEANGMVKSHSEYVAQ